jgi:hypothetical protein
MIKSGGSFFYKGKRCIIGAVISLKGLPYIVTASHIFHGTGDCVIVDGMDVAVKSILKDFDLALIELPPDCMVEITEFDNLYWRMLCLPMIHMLSNARWLIPEHHCFIWVSPALICRNREIAVLPSCNQGR